MTEDNQIVYLLPLLYLEVADNDESSCTDPASGETGCVQHAVLMLLNNMRIAQKYDHHHCRDRERERQR